MIYIQEHFSDPASVAIRVDGSLMGESVHALREVLIHHLKEGKNVSVNLKKLNYITREAKVALRDFEDKVIFMY